MRTILSILFLSLITLTAYSEINESTFKHHFISRNTPVEGNPGFGTSALADFDQDGDLDFAASTRRDKMYWYEFKNADEWEEHYLGPVGSVQLGGNVHDVDGDGWIDIVSGGCWYRNQHAEGKSEFQRFIYDDRINTEIHDIVIADINMDGAKDVVVLGDREGCHWYNIPDNPKQDKNKQDKNWERTLVTNIVLKSENYMHSGFATNGVGDLDQDGDADIVLPDRWMENREQGAEWQSHFLHFGSRGPYGVSSRSWIVDIDEDGDKDIIMVDTDQTGSQIAVLYSNGSTPPNFRAEFIPQPASGVRGSFHSLQLADFDLDGDLDIFTVEQEASPIRPRGAFPRWYIFENINGDGSEFVERIIFDGKLGGHDAWVGDVDNDGDPDICAKIWGRWGGNANDGEEHASFLENLAK